MSRSIVRFTSCIALVTALLTGCGGGSKHPRTAAVSGKVTFDGKPLETGSLLFVPVGGGPSAQGQINADGTYSLGTFTETDGAVLGQFKVMITAYSIPAGAAVLPENEGRGNEGIKSLIPEIYSDLEKSGLTATVTETANTIDFDLVKQAPKKAKG